MRQVQQLTEMTEQKQQHPHGFDTCGLLACLAMSVFFIAWITVSSRSLSVRSATFLFVLPWALLRAGSITTAAVRLPSFFALDFLLGVAAVSVVVLVWKVIVPLSLWILLIVLLVAIAGIPKVLPLGRREPLSVLGFLGVIVSLIGASGWSQDLILPARAIEGGMVFKPWVDFFFHATVVARSLTAQTLSQVGNYEWKGFPVFFYHYASYSIPLCLAKAASLRAYDTIVGFWAPLGSFVTGLASYALGRAFWNQTAGLAALVATFLIPDLWLLNIAHPAYGYFWLQQVSPAGLYGIAIAGTALILIVLGARDGRRVWIASGVVLGVLVVFFKGQIFAAAFPLLFSVAILTWPPRTRWRWFALGACVAAGVALLPVANRLYVGPNVRFDLSGSTWHWKVLAHLATGTRFEDLYQVFAVGHPFPSHLAQAIGLLLLNVLGIFVVIAPLVWLLAARRKSWQISEGISVGAIAILLVMTFGLGSTGTSINVYELIHRPFVWAYWLVGSLSAGRLVSVLAESHSRLLAKLVSIGAIALTLVPFYSGAGLQRGKWSGAENYSSVLVDRGLLDCAQYIRRQSPTNALAQDSHLDRFLILAGLGERPAFAARLDMWTKASQTFRNSSYQTQLQKLRSFQQARNIPDLQRLVRETGIRWYVVHPDDSNLWPAEFRDHPAFESNGYRVYDMNRCLELRG
jgi:hypothetical protein